MHTCARRETEINEFGRRCAYIWIWDVRIRDIIQPVVIKKTNTEQVGRVDSEGFYSYGTQF